MWFSRVSALCVHQGAPPLSTTPVANLPPVSSAANLPPVSLTLVDQYQAADTLKWTWRQKFIYMLILLPKVSQQNNLIEDFFHLPPESTILVVHVELRISPRIFEKLRNYPNGILKGLGETDSWKNRRWKSCGTVPLKSNCVSTLEPWQSLIVPLIGSKEITVLQSSDYIWGKDCLTVLTWRKQDQVAGA